MRLGLFLGGSTIAPPVTPPYWTMLPGSPFWCGSVNRTLVSYSGSIIQAVKPDGSVLDVGTAGGVLNEAAVVAFSGGQPVGVKKIYDQSGANRAAFTAANPTHAPLIYTGSAFNLDQKGKITARSQAFDDSYFLIPFSMNDIGSSFAFYVTMRRPWAWWESFFNFGSSTQNFTYTFYSSDSNDGYLRFAGNSYGIRALRGEHYSFGCGRSLSDGSALWSLDTKGNAFDIANSTTINTTATGTWGTANNSGNLYFSDFAIYTSGYSIRASILSALNSYALYP